MVYSYYDSNKEINHRFEPTKTQPLIKIDPSTSLYCKKCGSENKFFYDYCHECGINLGESKDIIINRYIQEEKNAELIICSECKSGNIKNSNYCRHCGAEFKQNSRYIPKWVKKMVWVRDGGKCVECGNGEDLQFDHIIPFSKEGANTVKNLQILCATCNRKKYNKIDG